MARQGLTRGDVVRAATELIESEGLHSFSLRTLAGRLHIQAASLYNHIKSTDELYTEIGYYAISELKSVQVAATGGKHRAQAIEALADAYYRFGKERPELYKVILSLPMIKNDALQIAAGDIVEPIMTVLGGYELTEAQKMHLQRILRSIMHGFIAQEDAGCFRHFPVDVSDSYRMAVRGFILLVESAEAETLTEAGGQLTRDVQQPETRPTRGEQSSEVRPGVGAPDEAETQAKASPDVEVPDETAIQAPSEAPRPAVITTREDHANQ